MLDSESDSDQEVITCEMSYPLTSRTDTDTPKPDDLLSCSNVSSGVKKFDYERSDTLISDPLFC